MTAEKPGRKGAGGRPKGVENTSAKAYYSTDVQVRAHQIFRESQCLASPSAIARQLLEEGYEPVEAQAIARWRRDKKWATTAVKTPRVAELAEDLRQAVRVRVPDDLNRVEQASNEISAVATAIAQRVMEELPNVKITTVAELEIATRCVSELLRVHLSVGKGLQDLRLLRVSSNFGPDANGAMNGEVIPPEKPSDPPPSQQAEIISNFTGP